MKRVYSLIAILMMSLIFVGCEKKQEPNKPTPGGTDNPKPDPEPEEKYELPLLTFTPDYEEIRKYETEIGRKPESIKYNTNQFDGYANEEFKLIPAVAYRLMLPDGSEAILTLGKEDIDRPTKTLAMLKEAGFTIEKKKAIDATGDEITYYEGENKDKIKVDIRPLAEKQFRTKIAIVFTKAPEMSINKNAKDFPSYKALLSKNVETINKFETELGLREPDKESKLWDEAKVNLMYETKSEELEAKATNIDWVYYVGTHETAPTFINSLVRGLSQAHLKSEEVKEWFAVNGYDTNPNYDKKNAVFAALNKDKTEMAMITSVQGNVLLQIFNPNDTRTSPAKVRSTIIKMMAEKNNNGITLKLYQKH